MRNIFARRGIRYSRPGAQGACPCAGVDASAGSLGQGISVACGFAMAARLQNNPCMTYAIVGDGEMQEGQVWEAVQFAAHQKLGRFVLIADMNKKQLDGLVDDVCCAFDVPGGRKRPLPCRRKGAQAAAVFALRKR